MGRNWMVAVDDSEEATYAFNWTLKVMSKDDNLFIITVSPSHESFWSGWTNVSIIDTLAQAEEMRSKKILVYYGRKASELQVPITLLKGRERDTGYVICDAAKEYDINHLVIGRRSIGAIKRLFSGSTSRYVLENSDCNVTVIKHAVGPKKDHEELIKSIQTEEDERLIEEPDQYEMEQREEQEPTKRSWSTYRLNPNFIQSKEST